MVDKKRAPEPHPMVELESIAEAQPLTPSISTSITAFVGRTARGPINTAVTCTDFADFQQKFGGLDPDSAVSYQAYGFFNNGGSQAVIVRLHRSSTAEGGCGPTLEVSDYTGDPLAKTGLHALTEIPYGFNILCIPPDDFGQPDGGDLNPAIYQAAAPICVENNAMLIVDPPTRWYQQYQQGDIESIDLSILGSYTAEQARACAVYFPRITIADPLQNGASRTLAPCGYLAAVWATTDHAVGVWKAPAGLDAPIGGVLELQAKLSDAQNGALNLLGINALRSFPGTGDVVWGARTMRGGDQLSDDFKYIPVKRLFNYIETSLLQGTRWAAFEQNGAALWAKLQSQCTDFMTGLFSQGAFAGNTAAQAFFVTCNATTTTPADQAAGICNISIGFAPLHPAEFVVATITQATASS